MWLGHWPGVQIQVGLATISMPVLPLCNKRVIIFPFALILSVLLVGCVSSGRQELSLTVHVCGTQHNRRSH